MLTVGIFEIALVLVVSLVVLGPEKLFVVARYTGLWMRKLRSFYGEFTDEFDRQLRIDEMQKSDQSSSTQESSGKEDKKKATPKPQRKASKTTSAKDPKQAEDGIKASSSDTAEDK